MVHLEQLRCKGRRDGPCRREGTGYGNCLDELSRDDQQAIIVVDATVKLFSMSIIPNDIAVRTGESFRVTLRIQHQDGTDVVLPAQGGVVWSSNNTNVSVDAAGVVTGVAVGSAGISATYLNESAHVGVHVDRQMFFSVISAGEAYT